jgi:hypothetical protein
MYVSAQVLRGGGDGGSRRALDVCVLVCVVASRMRYTHNAHHAGTRLFCFNARACARESVGVIHDNPNTFTPPHLLCQTSFRGLGSSQVGRDVFELLAHVSHAVQVPLLRCHHGCVSFGEFGLRMCAWMSLSAFSCAAASATTTHTDCLAECAPVRVYVCVHARARARRRAPANRARRAASPPHFRTAASAPRAASAASRSPAPVAAPLRMTAECSRPWLPPLHRSHGRLAPTSSARGWWTPGGPRSSREGSRNTPRVGEPLTHLPEDTLEAHDVCIRGEPARERRHWLPDVSLHCLNYQLESVHATQWGPCHSMGSVNSVK